MNEIYIIICESGHWDSYRTWVGGVFDDETMAQNECDKMNTYAQQIQDSCPVKKDPDNMSDEEEELYESWWLKNKKYAEWGPAKVVPYILNKTIEK